MLDAILMADKVKLLEENDYGRYIGDIKKR
jgi:hypothetical protein